MDLHSAFLFSGTLNSKRITLALDYLFGTDEKVGLAVDLVDKVGNMVVCGSLTLNEFHLGGIVKICLNSVLAVLGKADHTLRAPDKEMPIVGDTLLNVAGCSIAYVCHNSAAALKLYHKLSAILKGGSFGSVCVPGACACYLL